MWHMKMMYLNFGESIELTMEILNYIVLGVDILLLVIFSWYYITYFVNSFKKTDEIKLVNPKNKFAILIAARNESRVIRNILDSLRMQNYPKNLFDIYVIVEDELDPTVNIVNEYGHRFKVVVRKNIENRRTKGFALDDAIKFIKDRRKQYDAYLIFDADNLVSKNYLLYMNAIKEKGYQIGMGYRSFTNATINSVSMSSAILFSFINGYTNKGKSDFFHKISLTGTGYFVDSQIIDDAGGWIWNGMTEDVELTYYAYKNHIKMKYYPLISYFDEQPTDFRVLHNQHVRWVWGYFGDFKKKFSDFNFDYSPNESKKKKKYEKLEQKIGIYPFLMFVMLELIMFIVDFSLAITCLSLQVENFITINAFVFATYHLFIAFITFVLLAIYTILIDHKKLNFGFKNYIKVILVYPFFFLDFLLAFFDGLIHKQRRTNWKHIHHDGKIVDQQALFSQGGKN